MNLRELRLKKGISLTEAANALGCNASTLCRWEYGQNHIAPESLNRLRHLYQLTAEQTLRLAENPTGDETHAHPPNPKQTKQSKP